MSFQIWTTRGTGLVSSFDAVRTVCQLELWNHFSLRLFLQNRYCWLPQDVFDDSGGEQQQEGIHALALSCNYDWKGRYLNPQRGFFDSFFIWYSSETPVDTSRTPDATVWYSASMTEFQTSFAQNAPAWVAVAAMRLDEENQIGKVHELYLDWSNTPPRAPDDVVVLAVPLSAIDSEILQRPLEDDDLAIAF